MPLPHNEQASSFMLVGVPREIKVAERRVSLTPRGVRELVSHGHSVVVEKGAGEGSRIPDRLYEAQGARIVKSPEDVFADSDLILKVKEPQDSEVPLLHEGQVLFTYLHLAGYPQLAAKLQERKVIAIAYETVQCQDGRLPLLAPMSEIAGRMAVQVSAHYLEATQNGRGVLLGGVSGVAPAQVVVLGAGIAGSNAALVAAGMQAEVVALDVNIEKLQALDRWNMGRIVTVVSSQMNIEERVRNADVVVGTVLIPGASAPKLVTEDMVRSMKEGSVLVDVAIDQGGCFETSHETTHDDPIYVFRDVVHYAVGNLPGAVPQTATDALTNATMSYILALADYGVHEAIAKHPDLAAGVNIVSGAVCHPTVAASLGVEWVAASAALQ